MSFGSFGGGGAISGGAFGATGGSRSAAAPGGGLPFAGIPPELQKGVDLLLSGDVLFQGSVGRVDLPGGDWPTLERSIGTLVGTFAPQTVVHPGHMGSTTLGAELQSNPFLAELRATLASTTAPDRSVS